MTTERDADYQNLQRTIAELTVENERLKKQLSEMRLLLANMTGQPSRQSNIVGWIGD